MTWNKIDDCEVIHHWKCSDCDTGIVLHPDYYQDNGTPMCWECEQNMDYQHTECNQ